MTRSVARFVRGAVAFFLFVSCTFAATAQSPQVSSRVTAPVDTTQLATLRGNVHPLARAEFDQGEVADSTPAQRMMLVLQRGPEQEAALRALLAQQQDASSPQYHQWLTPQAFGQTFGPSDADIAAVTSWLAASGFTGIKVNAGRTTIEFSGTAGALKSALHTSLHNYLVNGVTYTANASDPQVPAALAPVVAGFASLNNFPRHPMHTGAQTFQRNRGTGRLTKVGGGVAPSAAAPTQRSAAGGAAPDYTFSYEGDTYYGITPYDFATIYNVSPLWSASTPIDGTGETIAIASRTDINPADFINFRQLFGLPLGNTATATGTQYLNIIYNGPDPGFFNSQEESEGDIDTQWSGSVAKGATIDDVISATTTTSDGVDLSAEYIIDNNLAPVMSLSYGACELYLGSAGNQFYNSLWQQGSAQGITIMVSAGDSGDAECEDAGVPAATTGKAVSGEASTLYDVAVGGTDFNILSSAAGYFSKTNSSNGSSALKYIPEIPWNDSCANSALGPLTGLTPEQTCNSPTWMAAGLLSVVGGGGGASACIASDGTSQSCTAGYPKPAWQTGTGVPSDGVRDVPDVSLFAANGLLGALYLFCQQDANDPSGSCNLSSPLSSIQGAGGTSFASPAFAGIMALVDQKTESRQGNANLILYKLFNQQTTAGTACNSSNSPAGACIFNDITTGSISQPCLNGTVDCTATTAGDLYGVLDDAATAGYDEATGLGSVNAANLVNGWASVSTAATTTTLTLSQTSIVHGTAITATAGVTSSSGTPTGNVSINGATSNGSVSAGALSGADTYTATVQNFPGGTYPVTAHYGGSPTFAESDSSPVLLTVTPESSVTTVSPSLYNNYTGAVSTVSGTVAYGSVNFFRVAVAGASGQGSATGSVTLKDNGVAIDGGIGALNSSGTLEDFSPELTAGTHNITASYAGDPSFNASQGSASLTITKASTSATLTAPSAISSSGVLTVDAAIDTTSFGDYAPTGTITLMLGAKAIGTATLAGSYDATDYDLGVAEFTIPASALTQGNNSITVVYAGDANYMGSTSAAAIVNVAAGAQQASITALTLSPTTFPSGASVTVGATVTPASPTATGTVAILVDGAELTSGTLTKGAISGSLSITATAGQHALTAVYSGDSNYAASTSNTETFTVTAPSSATTTSIALSAPSVEPGGSATATATVSPAAATGTVQLIVDGNPYGQAAAVAGGTATVPLPVAALQIGSHSIAFAYSGDATYQPSTSTTATLTVEAAALFTLTPSTASSTVTPGTASAATTLTVTPGNSFSGTVTFSCTGLPTGAACVFSPASVSITGTAAQTTALSFTAAPSAAALRQPSRLVWEGSSMLLTCLGLVFIPRRRRLRLAALLGVAVIFSGITLLSGCGGSSTGGQPSGGGTPAGSYPVTVTATGGSIVHSSIVTLTVE